MVIIRCNALLSAKAFAEEYERLVGMAKRGVVLLPNNFELLNEVPPDTEVVVVRPDAPTDAMEVKRAHWIQYEQPYSLGYTIPNYKPTHYCSNCDGLGWEFYGTCPHCGAKMRIKKLSGRQKLPNTKE